MSFRLEGQCLVRSGRGKSLYAKMDGAAVADSSANLPCFLRTADSGSRGTQFKRMDAFEKLSPVREMAKALFNF